MDDTPPIDPAWRTGARLIALAAALAMAWLAHDVLLLAFLGLLVGVVLSFPVGWLARRMKRGLAVLIVLAAMLAAGGAAIAFGAAKIAGEADTIREEARKGLQGIREKFEQVEGKERGQPQPPQGAAEAAAKSALDLFSGAAAMVLVIVLGLFLVNEPGVYRRGLRLLVPPRFLEAFDSAYDQTAAGLRKWVGGILVSMAIMGALTTVGLAAAGIHGWPALGLLTFFATFVPYLGAIASAIPGLLVGASQGGTHLLYAGCVYLGVHIVEGYLVQPLVMKRAVKLQPALLLAWQGFFSAVFGLLGAVVATPALVCAQILATHLWIERRLRKNAA
ncbi:MAG TPA: AI-2E family transporter [Myxococcales bacterium]|nr:AI-2E family transporter [Myxococcales bacterium]